MRIIVSKDIIKEYKKYTVVDSVEKVLEFDNVECLVLHSFTDDEVKFASSIAEIRKKFNCTFFYITNDPKAIVTLILNGMQGTVIEDDFYYNNEEDLDDLLESYGVENTALAVSNTKENLAIVRDFITSFSRGEERCSLPFFIQQTNSALSELESAIGKQELQIQEMGSSAITVFQRASQYINALDEKNKVFAQQLSTLTQQASTPRSRFGGTGVSLFPSVKYNPSPTKGVVVIREFSPCRYLTSFILAYQNYLKIMKNKRVKVVITIQKGKLLYDKYSSSMFTRVSQESAQRTELYSHELIVTNTPQKETLTGIMNAGTYDVIIIIDRLFGADVILNGTNVKQIAAVSGSTDLAKFKLNPKNCIFPFVQFPNAFLTLPTIKKFPNASQPDMRLAAYSTLGTTTGMFERMDKYIEVDVRR